MADSSAEDFKRMSAQLHMIGGRFKV